MVLMAQCSICEEATPFPLTEEEEENLAEYMVRGRSMGYIQDVFPRIPAWIRSACIDQYSGGFCICPKCCGEEVDE